MLRWEIFTSLFENEKIVAAGPYLSCSPNIHIQSFFTVYDSRGLEFVKNTYRCPKSNETKSEWILDTEVVF